MPSAVYLCRELCQKASEINKGLFPENKNRRMKCCGMMRSEVNLMLVLCHSLRTLCRALSVAALNRCGSVLRSLYEALCLSFLTQLDYSSHPVVQQLVAK